MSKARKDDQGKLRYDLIPPGPLRELARVYTIGAAKYADDNWKLGLDRRRIEAALMRHFEASRDGETHDQQDGQWHLASVAWCAFALLWYDLEAEKDDTQDILRKIHEAGIVQPTCGQAYERAAAISSENDGIARELDKRANNRVLD